MPRRDPVHARRAPTPVVALAAALALGAIAGIVALGFTSGADAPSASAPSSPETTATPPPATPTASADPTSPTPAPAPDPAVQFTLVTGGDILTHGPVLRSAQLQGGGSYNFAPLMENVRPFIAGPDLALCHLEVPIVPDGVEPSGYPVFGAPLALVDAIDDEGWDGCSTASNHSMDRRFTGVETTLDAFDVAQLGHAGTARTEQEAERTQMYSVRVGPRVVTVATISYTYGLNGLPKPEGKPWAVDTFNADDADVAPILASAQAARDAGADVVIASVHCCVEYRIAPGDAQRSIVEQIADSGLVDLYVGHHAHVPQPIEKLDGGPGGAGMWAAFGHGNYLSNQDTQCCVADTNSGYIMTSTFTVAPDGAVDVAVEWTGITVDRLDRHTMYVLSEILDTGAGNISAAEAQARHRRVADAVGSAAPERTSAAGPLADAAYRNLRWWQPAS